MTEKTCSAPTPEQRKYLEIRDAAERSMLDKVFKAIDVAAAEVADGFKEAVWNSSRPAGSVYGSAADLRPVVRVQISTREQACTHLNVRKI
ncbi:hypothetical protein JNB88_24625 [Rhizobium cauense]|uniref:hypothetical protein n=1 Tax=Rhizobium cauense TaxID=1166683 RepID=UPI001C6E284C|nr:hypothetical protein [Rhizobium cauense]MBW9116820.1 hypothetical protein [Rhizobium cauense]